MRRRIQARRRTSSRRIIRASNKRSYLLRVRMPFGGVPNPKNLLTKLSNYPKLVDQLQSMSCVDDVARAAVWFAMNRPKPGVYNCVNPGALRIRDIADEFGWDKPFFDAAGFRQSIKAPRSECVLSTDKMQRVFPMRPAHEAMRASVAEYRGSL